MDETPFDRLHRISVGYMQSSILAAAAELDLFTLILENGKLLSAEELSALAGTDARATGVLLDALAAMELLEKHCEDDRECYSVTDSLEPYLHGGSPESYIPMLRHMANGQRTWSRLAWSVKDGQPQPRQESMLGARQDRISFIQGMNSIAVRLAGPTVETLHRAGVLSFSGRSARLLDIGGASGTYTLAFLKKLPDARATIFDLPVGISEAEKRFSGSEYEKRIELVAGDFLRDLLPTDFDFAWISAIIHSFGRDESRQLYANAFQALNPGGRVAVRDYIMSPDRTSPAAGAFFGVNMLVNSQNGIVYTFAEVKEDLEAAGFADVYLAIPSENMSAVVVAGKPG